MENWSTRVVSWRRIILSVIVHRLYGLFSHLPSHFILKSWVITFGCCRFFLSPHRCARPCALREVIQVWTMRLQNTFAFYFLTWPKLFPFFELESVFCQSMVKDPNPAKIITLVKCCWWAVCGTTLDIKGSPNKGPRGICLCGDKHRKKEKNSIATFSKTKWGSVCYWCLSPFLCAGKPPCREFEQCNLSNSKSAILLIQVRFWDCFVSPKTNILVSRYIKCNVN